MGRTPISIPPNVELHIGEPTIRHDATTYFKIARRMITVTGPLGKAATRGGREKTRKFKKIECVREKDSALTHPVQAL